MYGIVKDWQIKEIIRNLPNSTKQVSNLPNASKEKLLELGYYKVVGASTPLKEWQSYWEPEYTIKEDHIEETKPVIDQPLEEYKEKKTKQLSDKCHSDITAQYTEEDQINMMREFARLQDKFNATGEKDTSKVEELRRADKWIEDRRAEYSKQKEHIQGLSTYKEVKEYVDSLYPNEEELWV